MKKYIFAVFAVAAVLSSCSKNLEPNGDINSEAKAITTIGASTEISTRAVVSSSDDTKVNWEAGDQLDVLGANSSSEARNLAYELTAGTGSTIGTFQNNSSDITTISAVMYPYQASASWDGTNSKLICEIPSVQKATKVNSFDKDAAVMYSIGNTTNVQLNYAVNFLKVTVSETNVHAISISSSTTALSGKMEITSTGVTEASDGSLKGVTLIPATDDVLPTGDYYIAVKAGNIENPTISYVYYNDDHTATEKSKAGSGTLTFASGTNVKPISVDFTSGTITTRNAVQLWAGGPYWATMNVGAEAPEGSGQYFAWGDVEGQTWIPQDGETAAHWSGSGFSSAPALNPANPSILPLYYDAAAVNWNTAWRMPTGHNTNSTDLTNLVNNTDIVWDDNYNNSGIKVTKFTGRSEYAGNTLVIPCAGYGDGSNLNQPNKHSYCWSSCPFNGSVSFFLLNNGNKSDPSEYTSNVSGGTKSRGCSVRAVLE